MVFANEFIGPENPVSKTSEYPDATEARQICKSLRRLSTYCHLQYGRSRECVSYKLNIKLVSSQG